LDSQLYFISIEATLYTLKARCLLNMHRGIEASRPYEYSWSPRFSVQDKN